MTEKRKEKLLAKVLRGFVEYHLLHLQRAGTAAGRTEINDVRKVGNYG